MARILLSSVIEGRDPHAVTPDTTLIDASRLLCADWTHGALPVVEGDALVGLISKRDLLCRGICAELDFNTATVAEIMTRDPETLDAEDTMADAYRLMASKGYRHIPVLSGGKLAGMVAYREVPVSVRNLAERFAEFSHSTPEKLEH